MDSDQRKREEDFYYTEVQMKDESEPESTPRSPSTVTAPLLIQPVTPQLVTPALEVPSVESPLPSALSQSAPGSFWHIQADHAYQALPSIQIPVSPHIFTSISWAAAAPLHAPNPLSTASPLNKSDYQLLGDLFAVVGKFVVKPRNAVRSMALNTGTSGAPPAGGKKPARGSSTEPLATFLQNLYVSQEADICSFKAPRV
ncbi:unnamed protein product [Ranitomeya imitator]|uniref:Uncharacterized protein n=1 Tax=Ranitomeya imitator TaxID=111125 RepID=A0ABN9LB75_9NEOB|nr:unnamed protein product [Ranitomeya imitator]